jgi:hypothetical protein
MRCYAAAWYSPLRIVCVALARSRNCAPSTGSRARRATSGRERQGSIRCNCAWINVSTVCAGEYVGLNEIDDGVWNVYFGALKLGRLLEPEMKIEDAYGRLYRPR